MKKSEFLKNMGTATARLAAGMSPETLEGFGTARDKRMLYAGAHLSELGILAKNSGEVCLDRNPIVMAVVWFSQRQVTRSSSLEDMEMAEAAWEHFEEMQVAADLRGRRPSQI